MSNNFGFIRPLSPKIILACTRMPTTITERKTDELISWTPDMINQMDSPSADWEASNWSNGGAFNCTWKPENVHISGDGLMRLVLDVNKAPGKNKQFPYVSGEYRTKSDAYKYGFYEARMKIPKASGVVSAFFLYGDNNKKNHEIDFEFMGKDTNKVQLNYFVEGKGGHEIIIDLGFDASEDFHNYGIKWSFGEIIWYVDGKEIYKVQGDVPCKASRLILNCWTGSEDWLGKFQYPGKPIETQYDWIKYSSLSSNPNKENSSKRHETAKVVKITHITERPVLSPAPNKP